MNYRFEHGIIIIHASNPKLALILNYTHYDVLYEERRMRAYYFLLALNIQVSTLLNEHRTK
jgi:hypothetical protein